MRSFVNMHHPKVSLQSAGYHVYDANNETFTIYMIVLWSTSIALVFFIMSHLSRVNTCERPLPSLNLKWFLTIQPTFFSKNSTSPLGTHLTHLPLDLKHHWSHCIIFSKFIGCNVKILIYNLSLSLWSELDLCPWNLWKIVMHSIKFLTFPKKPPLLSSLLRDPRHQSSYSQIISEGMFNHLPKKT